MKDLSKQIEFETPKWLFDALYDIFRFDTDLFASDTNHLCDDYFTKENCAFDSEWGATFL